MNNFRTHELAVRFYGQCQTIRLPAFLKNQLLRAASSVALNLMEGRGRSSTKDQLRFFDIALGSVRECQSISKLHPAAFSPETLDCLDHLGASAYQLIRQIRSP